jgi:hypothetical protein
MGEAKRRKAKLGESYGVPKVENKPDWVKYYCDDHIPYKDYLAGEDIYFKADLSAFDLLGSKRFRPLIEENVSELDGKIDLIEFQRFAISVVPIDLAWELRLIMERDCVEISNPAVLKINWPYDMKVAAELGFTNNWAMRYAETYSKLGYAKSSLYTDAIKLLTMASESFQEDEYGNCIGPVYGITLKE